MEYERTNQDMTKEYKEENWPNNAMQTLILKCEYICVNLNQENIFKKHLDKIENDVNLECGTYFIGSQCNYKWKRLYKTFKKNKQMVNNIGEAMQTHYGGKSQGIWCHEML